MPSRFLYKGAIALLLGMSSSASAVPIPIANAGFENPPTAFFTAGNISGWVIEGSGAGVWNLNDMPTSFWSVPAPEGKQVGFVAREDPGGPASISQVLGDTLLANSWYTLTGRVGHPVGNGESRGTVYTVELLAGTTVLNSVSTNGPEGTFTSFVLTFDSTGSAHVGEALRIRLSSNQAQSAFDDIQLNVEAAASVPEPSTFLLTPAAVLALLRYRRPESKRRRRA
jgi:hypothetical protein